MFLVWGEIVSDYNPALNNPGAPGPLAGLNPDTMKDDQLFDYARNLASNNDYSGAYVAFLRLTKTPRFKTDANWQGLWNLLQQKTGLGGLSS